MKKAGEAQPNQQLRNLRLTQNWTQANVAAKIDTTSLNVSRWERGLLIPSLYFRQKLCELFGKSVEELGLSRDDEYPNVISQQSDTQQALSQAGPPHYWHIPYQRNPFFTGRAEILSGLHAVLQQEQTGSVTPAYALSGPGGIGKTQIVLEYAYAYAPTYEAIFWIEANTRENIVAGFASIASLLQLPEKDCPDQDRMVITVKRWLHTHSRWLLIFDDVEEPELVKSFLPAARNGAILLTTQRATLGMIALNLEVERMSLEEATLLLLLRARLLERGKPLEQHAPADALVARKIAEIMDGLPLALDQAGAYIAENKCSLAEFLRLFQEHPLRLLDERGFCTAHPRSVVETFALAFRKLQQKSPAAAGLLTLCCFMDLDTIPEAVFLENSAHPLLRSLVTNALQFNVLLKELLSFSLISRNCENRTLTIHRLVQIVLKELLDKQMRRQWANQARKRELQTFPVGRIDGPIITIFVDTSLALSS